MTRSCQHCINGWFQDQRYGQDVECVNGVLIDIDEAHEGIGSDVVRAVAPCHPCWAKQLADPDGKTWENDSIERLEEWRTASTTPQPKQAGLL